MCMLGLGVSAARLFFLCHALLLCGQGSLWAQERICVFLCSHAHGGLVAVALAMPEPLEGYSGMRKCFGGSGARHPPSL